MSPLENLPDSPRRDEANAIPSTPDTTGTPAEIPWALPVAEALVYAEPAEESEMQAAKTERKLPSPGFWQAVLWCVCYATVTNVAVIAVIAFGLVIHIAFAANGKALWEKIQDPEGLQSSDFKWEWAAAFLVCEVVSVFFAYFVIRLVVGRGWRRQLAWRRPSVCHLGLTLLTFPVVLYAANLVYLLASQVLRLPSTHYNKQLTDMFGEWPWWFGVVAVGLGPAVSEELFCRGFLGRGLVGRYGPYAGVVLTSLFFGILHLDPPHVLATFVMGIALHFTYLMTRSLWMPMLLHFLNNSTAVLAITVPELQDGNDEPTGNVFWLLITTLLLGAALAWAFTRSRVRFVDSENRSWSPDYPGAQYPPITGTFRTIRPWPGWLPSMAVLLAFSAFVAVLWQAG